jgi:threonyl-tRNA synthetase
MRALIWHVSALRAEVTERGRSPLVEPAEPPIIETGDALLVFAAVERSDEEDPVAVARTAAEEIAAHAKRLRVERVAVLPFAHLFADLASPTAAVAALNGVVADLRARGVEAERAPFGWFHTLDIRAKGHPISRISRTFAATR